MIPTSAASAVSPSALPQRRRHDYANALGFGAIVALIVVLALLSLDLLSAARAHAVSESQRSKAQKVAVQQLGLYARNGSHAEWKRYEAATEVMRAAHAARRALNATPPDEAAARAAFLRGGSAADDVAGMIRLFRWGRKLPLFGCFGVACGESDELAAQFEMQAAQLRAAAEAGGDARALHALLLRVHELDDRLTAQAVASSTDLGEAVRLVRWVFGSAVVALASLVVGAGVFLAHRQARLAVATEATLRESEERFRSLWVTTSDSILIVDTEDRIVYANPAVQKMFGRAAEEMVGQPLAIVQPERLRAAHRRASRHYLQSGVKKLDWRAVETLALHGDGSEFPVEIAFSEMDLRGQRHFVGFLRDISVRKRAEERLRQANETLEQRVAERTQELTAANAQLKRLDHVKSEFLATMSHELRTPLNAIIGFSSLLRDGMTGPVSEEQRRQLGFVHGAGQHLLALVNDLLDVTRIEAGRMLLQPGDFDAAEVLAEVLAALGPAARGKRLILAGTSSLPCLPVHGDRGKCLQILLNLAGNAVKFTEKGVVRLSLGVEGGWLVMTVTDTGIGITAEQLPRLFARFQQLDGGHTRAYEGSGLGLYLSRKLAEAMGGVIEVQSTPGVGSIFEVRLPRVLASQPALPAPAAPCVSTHSQGAMHAEATSAASA